MTRFRRATASTVCALGLTLGGVAWAPSAYATEAYGTYSCNGIYAGQVVKTTWWRGPASGFGTPLEVSFSLTTPIAADVDQISIVVNGERVANTLTLWVGDYITLGPSSIPTSPFTPLSLTIYEDFDGDGLHNHVLTTCVIDTGSGFPL